MPVVEPIAVVGVAARMPEAPDVEQYWRNLVEGRDCFSDLSYEQLLAAGEDPALLANPAYVRRRPLLPDMADFDAGFFGLTPREAELRDPQHRLFLELCHTVLGHAGYDASRYPGTVGIFAGATANRYAEQNLRTHDDMVEKVGELGIDITNNADYLATFVSYKLGLRGPSLTVATACSTSMVAIHLASQALRAGECDMAIAGGVEVEMPYGRGYVHAPGGIYSRDGHSRPFDAQADGTVFGSGGGTVLLKRLVDAQEDGDQVLAVIRGSAINNDGSEKVGFSAPSVQGQARCVAEAYAVADVDPAGIGYMEAHGTATVLGDPMEITALTQAFRSMAGGELTPGSCALGSVKSNIGHLGPASGVAGLIKTVLALHREQIPPSINFVAPNPHLQLDRTPFRVVTELTDWPRTGTPRRAGVSSFGIGGTNAHVVVEEAPLPPHREPDTRAQLLVWSARDEQDETAIRADMARLLAAEPSLADVAFTLQSSRTGRRAARTALVSRHAATAAGLLAQDRPAGLRRSDGVARTRVFAFPGQGAQQPGMAGRLRADNPVFRGHFDALLAAFSAELGVDLAEEARSGTAERIARTELAQPLLCALELALARTLMDCGVTPDLVIGHSIGELVAAAVAGVLPDEDVVRAVSARALAMRDAQPGAMLAVKAAPGDLAGRLSDGVSISAVNAASQTVLGGPVELIRRQAESLRADGYKVRELATSHAFHTPMMAEAARSFADALRDCPLKAPVIPIISAATGQPMTDEQACDPDFWAGQLTAPVLFAEAAVELLSAPATVVEVGPGNTLSTLLRGAGGDHLLVPVLPGEPAQDRETFLDALGALWVSGADVDWTALHTGQERRISLPAYPYRRTRYWISPPARTPRSPSAPVLPAPATGLADAGSLSTASVDPDEVGVWTPFWTQEALALPDTYQEPGERGTALVILGAAPGTPGPVASALRVAGYRVVQARLAPEPQLTGSSLRIRPGSRADVEGLLNTLEPRPARVVQVLGADPAADAATAAEDGFFTALAVCQALVAGPAEFTVVTTGAVDVSGGERLDPAAAMLTGLVRTVAEEMPTLQPRLIDLSGTVSAKVLAVALTEGEEPVSALRGQHRWLPGWRPAGLAGARPELLRRGGVYLITGGLGSLGLETARALAETGTRPRLALLGRAGLPAGAAGDHARTVLAELAEQDVRVLTLAADLTDTASLSLALDEVHRQFGPVNGVLHAAGVAGGGLLALRDHQQAAGVLAPKVRGTETLVALLDSEPDLDFMLMYSSRAAITGLMGSGDYAAANAYLDALAGRTVAGAPVLSVNWPAWSGVGMAARSAGLSDVRAAAGNSPKRPTAADHEWTTTLDPAADWVLAEHRVAGQPVLPGTGHIDLVIRAARACGVLDPAGPVELSDLVFVAPLAARQPVKLRVAFETGTFRLLARPAAEPASEWTEFSRGRIRAADPEEGTAVDPGELLGEGDVAGVDEPSRGAAALVDMGPRWGRAVDVLASAGGDRVAELSLDQRFAADLKDHPAHPALLDRATGLVQGAAAAGHLPFHYQRLVLLADLPADILVRAHHLRAESRMLTGDVDLYDRSGRHILLVRGFRMRQAGTEPTPAPSDAAELADALTPEQGVRQLLRILSGRLLGQVAVTPAGSTLAVARPAAAPSAAPAAVPDTPERAEPVAKPGPGQSAAGSGADPTAPAPGIESELHSLWAEALGVPDLGLDDDFFDKGGDSLAAVQLTTRINGRFGVEISIGTLFEHSTVRLMTQTIEGK